MLRFREEFDEAIYAKEAKEMGLQTLGLVHVGRKLCCRL
jgi:hypothetical protein